MQNLSEKKNKWIKLQNHLTPKSKPKANRKGNFIDVK